MGLIYEETLNYWRQNNTTDIINIMTLFIQRITKRGHSLPMILPIFQQATSFIDNKNTRMYTPITTKTPKTYYIFTGNTIPLKKKHTQYTNYITKC